MKSKAINVSGIDVTCYENGELERVNIQHGNTIRSFGSKKPTGYFTLTARGKGYQAHRLIAQAFLPDWDENLQVDHINGDKADNRVENLRMVTFGENIRAFCRKKKNCSSRFRGVSIKEGAGKWIAQISIKSSVVYLGNFKCEEAAAIARDRAAINAGYDSQSLNITRYPELSAMCGLLG